MVNLQTPQYFQDLKKHFLNMFFVEELSAYSS